MPGARLKSFRLGDRSELLVQHLLSGIAFTNPVPRQEDVGYDFTCSLIADDGSESLLRAGTFFCVQAKSNTDPLIFEKKHELEWITNQENPLLICVADRDNGAMDVYSTWNLLHAIQAGWRGKERKSLRLLPGKAGSTWPGVDDLDDGSQDVCLGDPIVRISLSDLADETRTREILAVMKVWLALDRDNIFNRYAGLHWVIGPLSYETGKAPGAQVGFSFHRNVKNLPKCIINLGRSGTAVWCILRDTEATITAQELNEVKLHLPELLRPLCSFDPALREFLKDIFP